MGQLPSGQASSQCPQTRYQENLCCQEGKRPPGIPECGHPQAWGFCCWLLRNSGQRQVGGPRGREGRVPLTKARARCGWPTVWSACPHLPGPLLGDPAGGALTMGSVGGCLRLGAGPSAPETAGSSPPNKTGPWGQEVPTAFPKVS